MTIKHIIDDAKRKTREAIAARDSARSAIFQSVKRLMPPGTVIDLRNVRNLPEHLRLVKTVAGRDHGTRIFRIERITTIGLDSLHPELATWEADAIPISEKTGKDMDGSVARRNGKAVRLCGSITHQHEHGLDEPSESQLARMVALLDAHSPSAEADAAAIDSDSAPGM